MLISFQLQLLIARQGQWAEFGQLLTQVIQQIQFGHGQLHAIGLQAGQGQQLGHHPGGPLHPAQQLPQSQFAVGRVGGLAGVLGMDTQHRQGRAQFMGGIGNKALFLIEQLIDLGQQAVERGAHGLQLLG